MGAPNEYLHYAERCEQLASCAKESEEKKIFLEMALAWTHVARAALDVSHESTVDRLRRIPRNRYH